MVHFSKDEKETLSKYGVKVERDLPIFIKELYAYLKNEWHEDSHHELEPLKNNDIEGFNMIIGFPGNRGFAIIDDSFTEEPYENSIQLSNTSKQLLGWIYGIYLHE